MTQLHAGAATGRKLTPADLASAKPDETFLWRLEMTQCSCDHATQMRRWSESEKIRQLMTTTGAPTSSTMFDGEKNE